MQSKWCSMSLLIQYCKDSWNEFLLHMNSCTKRKIYDFNVCIWCLDGTFVHIQISGWIPAGLSSWLLWMLSLSLAWPNDFDSSSNHKAGKLESRPPWARNLAYLFSGHTFLACPCKDERKVCTGEVCFLKAYFDNNWV